MKPKKKFKDTKVGQWLNEKVPKALDKIGDVLPDKGLLGIVKNIVDTDPDVSPELRKEFAAMMMDFELDLYKYEVEDRVSARQREVEMAKTGRTDHLMYAAGYTALIAFVLMICAVIWIPQSKENPLFHQLMGIIEGVALTVFGYYFGTSASSKAKDEHLKNLTRNP